MLRLCVFTVTAFILFHLLLYRIIPDTPATSHPPLELSKQHTFMIRDEDDLTATLVGNAFHGIQHLQDRLAIDPVPLASEESRTVEAFSYYGHVLKFVFAKLQTHIQIIKHSPHSVIYVHEEDGARRTRIYTGIFVQRGKFYLQAVPNEKRHWSKTPYIFESDKLPEQQYMPELGNGHIATAVNSLWVHMNGLYNGNVTQSSRAKIPSLVAFQVRTNHTEAQLVSQTFTLNVREGTFEEVKVYSQPNIIVVREVFAHREIERLLVSRVTIRRPELSRAHHDGNGDAVEIWIEGLPDKMQLSSSDITFSPTTDNQTSSGIAYRLALGQTNVPEVPDVTNVSSVAVAWHSNVRNITINGGENGAVFMTAFVAIGLDADDSVKALEEATSIPYQKLIEQHSAKWLTYWKNGFMYVNPKENFELAQALYGSFYYLLSSLPNQQDNKNRFIGLSPGGLAHGANNQDYSGHIFWDAETWMFPPILSFHPDQARLLIEARTGTLTAAMLNAISYGLDGAKYAWESAFSGYETSPWPATGQYEIHITADIAFAVRQFIYATDDKAKVIQDMKLVGMAVEMARFWQSRATCNDAGNCSIVDVMPPDEYHNHVNNSIYTNYVAKLALELPAYLLGITGGTHSDLPLWNRTASSLSLPVAITRDGKVYHPEFDGFTPGIVHPLSHRGTSTVKQADVILLGYPLNMNMSAEIRQIDLEVYEPITDKNGPAMTWGMFAVGYLDLSKRALADQLFEKNYENIVQPFGVWSEEPNGQGAVNFLTGMGGFLQAVVNGYGGIRLHVDHVALNPQPLPQTTHWKLVGYRYLGYQLDITFNFSRNKITFQTVAKNSTTHLVLALECGKVYSLAKVGRRFSVSRQKAVMRALDFGNDVFTNVLIDDAMNSSAIPPSMISSIVLLMTAMLSSGYSRF